MKTALHEIQNTLDDSEYDMAQAQWESFIMELQTMDESQEEADE